MKASVIRTTLRAALLQVPNLPTVQWEAAPFVAPASGQWLEDEVRLGTLVTGANGTTLSRPLYLLTIHTAPQRITDDLDTLVDAIGNAFEPGRTLTDSDRTTQLEITTLDAGALRVMPDGWGFRRLTIGASAWALRTSLISV